MARADGIEHILHLVADRCLFLGGEGVVSGLDQARIALQGEGGIGGQIVEDPAFALSHANLPEFAGGQFIAPVAERSLREFHDVALVHQGDVALACLQAEGVLDGLADVALAAELAHRLDADACPFRNAPFAELAVGGDHHVVEVLNQLDAHRIARLPFDPHVDVFRVFPVDDHIQILRPFVGAGRAFVIAAGPHAAVKIEDLPQGHVERTDPAPDRGGEGPFDGHAVGADRREGVFGQVLVSAVELTGFIARIHLEPGDPAGASVGLSHRRIKHPLGGGPDVHPGAIATDEGDDGIVRHDGLALLKADGGAAGGRGELLVGGHAAQGRSQ